MKFSRIVGTDSSLHRGGKEPVKLLFFSSVYRWNILAAWDSRITSELQSWLDISNIALRRSQSNARSVWLFDVFFISLRSGIADRRDALSLDVCT